MKKCNHSPDKERRVWVVQMGAGEEWTTPACCQLEAWDNVIFADGFVSPLGLVVVAREADASEDEQIAIHTVGLLLRYGHPELAKEVDDAGIAMGLGSVIGKYTGRRQWVRGGALS